MAQADEAPSKLAFLPDNLPVENVSGWLIWETIIVVAFIILSLLTLYFFLPRAGFFELFRRKKKRRSRPAKRKKSRFFGLFRRKKKRRSRPAKRKKSGFFKSRKRKPKARPKARRQVSRSGRRPQKRSALPTKNIKSRTGKAKRKSGFNPRKMPFLPSPGMIRSYTKKYLAGSKINVIWEKVGLVGYDSGDNPLDLEVFLLTKEFQWFSGKSDGVAYHNEPVKPVKYLKNKGLKKAFQKADSLVSVGMVTEMLDGDQKEGLARARAEMMIVWLKQAMRKVTVGYLLNLDDPKHEWGNVDEEDRKVDEQRSVLWICLQKAPAEVNIEEALKDALSKAIQLPFDFDIYQNVTLERVDDP